MTKPNKGSKQASMLNFFAPKKPGEELDVFAAEAEAKSTRSQASVESEVNSTAKTETESKPKVAQGKMKGKTKPKPKAKGKTKNSPKAKAKPKKKRQTRGISPHFAAGDESDEDEDLSDDEAFNTPEAKRARAELETGGNIVPAGAIISDDAVVEGADIVDVSAEEAVLETHVNKEAEEQDPAKDEAVNVEAVVDLTAPNSAEDELWTENGDSKKTRVKATAAKTNKATTKNPTKRQAKMKEKAAEAKAAPVEPLDPAVQARVDTYKLKMEELTRQYTELQTSKQASDAVMQEIYGAALDRDLDVSVDAEKSQQVLTETWQKLQSYVDSSDSTTDAAILPATVEFPHEVKCLVAKEVQGRAASLSVIASEILASFKKALGLEVIGLASTKESNSSDTKKNDSSVLLALEMEIKMLAQRTPHGVRPGKANVFEDTNVDALWTWEIGSVDKYFGDEAQKVIKRMRKHRKRLGQQLKTLARVVQLLHQKPVDEAKVSAEEAKVGKFVLVVDAELQKAKDREAKEEEKRSAAEEKKRHGMERQQAKEAKEAEKKKREREEEDSKKKVLNKRLKVFQKLFTSAPGTSDSTIDVTGDRATDKAGESKNAEIDRMDAAISFLSSSGDASSFSVEGTESIISSLKSQRDSDRASAGCWSARRHRDPKLGVMKLLQFYENNRPAYYGTFNAKKRLLRAGRRPLTHYAEFDYSVDSDDEWEEEEPGESLSDDENDAEDIGGDDLDYGDDWLAYEDDVEYMDDVATEDRDDETVKHKKKRVKVKALKSVQPAKLEPQIIGPFWCSGNPSEGCTDHHFADLAGELLCEPVFESTLMRKAREYEEEQKRLEAVRQEQQRKNELLEKEKLKAVQKAKQDLEMAANQPDQSTPAKTAPLRTSPGKTTPAKATPQKSKTQKTPSKPSPSLAKSVSASPSPAKPPQIDSFFKKVAGPVSVPPKPHDPKRAADEQQELKDGKVDIISVD